MKITNFSSAYLNQLILEAEQSTRLRQHRNVHLNYQDSCQRLFNAIGVESYIRPHRHLLDPKVECLIAVRGLMTLITFDEFGHVIETIEFGTSTHDTGADNISIGVELQPGIWPVIANVPGSVLFEVKAGPFNPEQAKEWAEWAPEEGTSEAQKYLSSLREKLVHRSVIA